MKFFDDHYYEWRHVVGLQETNIVGNVYFSHYVSWQGRCREMFLRQVCPEILTEIEQGLKMFTLKVECEYLNELQAFDEIAIRLGLEELTQSQIAFAFDYLRIGEAGEQLVAKGRQRVVCMRIEDGVPAPVRVPDALRLAFERLAATPPGSILTSTGP
ncbi:acyl-CoA thioesterase [Nocardia sp. NPDC101769]|uniref:acyl-CoA thioesterase n=1 Tax=Nocardia sp. NPDC101769 TaxID=3364333 RepID=UPI003805D7E2